MTQFNVADFNVQQYDDILSKGLSKGLGNRQSTMCIEAAICTVLNFPHGDNPKCVTNSVRSFKIALNDKNWSSPEARAKGLRDLGLAQLGSLSVVDNLIFAKRLSEEIIGQLLPTLVYEIWPNDEKFKKLAKICEKEKSKQSAVNLEYAAYAAYVAANAAASAACADAAYAACTAANAVDANTADAAYAAAANAADVAANAADAANAANVANATVSDKYLILAAKLALDILIELKSPGCELLGVR